MKNLFLIALCAASAPAFAHNGPAAGPGMVMHNSVHKVEHLVEANKIDQHFQDRAYSFTLSKVQPAAADAPVEGPAFKATVSQVPDANGKASTLEILLTDEGKAVSYKEIAGPESRNAPVWPDADALSLLENGMHYVLDNVATKPELKPFNNAMESMTLTQVLDADKRPEAQVVITGKDLKQVLVVLLKTDGTVDSAKIIDQTKK